MEQQYEDEQSMEIEALQSIFMDDLRVVSEGSRPVTWNCCSASSASQASSSDVYAVEVWPQSDDGMKDENAEFGVEFIFAHTPSYPDEAPLVHVSSIRGLSKQHMEECARQVCDAIEENMGMSMMYTLVSVVQEWLNGLDMEKQEASLADDPAVLEKKRREEEEARIAALGRMGIRLLQKPLRRGKKHLKMSCGRRLMASRGKRRHGNCGMPYRLSNFQGNFECPMDVRVGKPHNLQQLGEILNEFDKVKAVGNGHSFNKEFLCAGNGTDSINIVMTELDDTRKYILAPPSPDLWLDMEIPDDFPIQVDEQAMTVNVSAGITQRILLDYLSDYVHWDEPKGWTLPAFSWFIDQTMAGAVATGTHGSSMRYGSLSSQILAMDMMLANGTIITITPENKHLWNAAGVHVGQLGIITSLLMRIVPQQAVEKTVYEGDFQGEFSDYVQKVSSDYKKALEIGDVDLIKEILHLKRQPWFVKENIAPEEIPQVEAFDANPDMFVFPQNERYQPLEGVPAMAAGDSKMWSRFFRNALETYATEGTFESRKAYLSMIDQGMSMHAGFSPYNQFEVAIPLTNVAECLPRVLDVVYGDEKLYEGFRTPGLVRFTPGESFYLSNAQGDKGPHMWINLEDYVTFSDPNHTPNEKFFKVIRLFVEECDARLHWGKAGFQEAVDSTDYNVVEKYGNNWCSFGCAVHQLDPTRKFSSMNDTFWEFYAKTSPNGPTADSVPSWTHAA
eukprot:jgi/Picre1/31761/NNA_007111.t1